MSNKIKGNLYIGIDNGKHGAVAIINDNREILRLFKYDVLHPTMLYDVAKDFLDLYENVYAFVERPIVVYGLAHQTAPFETFGKHLGVLDALRIPYQLGNPSAGASDNWKRLIGLFEEAKSASSKNSKEISTLNKEAKAIIFEALNKGYTEDMIKKDKKAYLPADCLPLALKYKEIKKQIDGLKRAKKTDVKNVSIEKCLELFPSAEKLIKKSERAVLHKYDDDMAEALLLAECCKVLYGKA